MPFIIFVILVFAMMMIMPALKKVQTGEVNVNLGKIKKKAAFIILTVFALLILFKSIVIIHPGQVGVVVFFGDVKDRPLQNGIHIIWISFF